MNGDDPIARHPGLNYKKFRLLTHDEQLLSGVGPDVPAESSGDPARIERIREEFEMGFSALAKVDCAVSLFGSARTPEDDPTYALAREIARKLGDAGFTIITGGGPGVMEAANRGAKDSGALSVGLNIELPFEQSANEYLDISLEFEHFYARKVMFVRYSTAFVTLPGGFGTLDELFEALTLIQTQKIHHFPVVVAGDGYWNGLIKWMRETMAGKGNIFEEELELLRPCNDPDEIVEIVDAARNAQRTYYTLDGKTDVEERQDL